MLNSKTYTHNAEELTKLCMEKWGTGFWAGKVEEVAVLTLKHYTKLVHSWLEENWNINDYFKEEVIKRMTASWFIEKILKQTTD